MAAGSGRLKAQLSARPAAVIVMKYKSTGANSLQAGLQNDRNCVMLPVDSDRIPLQDCFSRDLSPGQHYGFSTAITKLDIIRY